MKKHRSRTAWAMCALWLGIVSRASAIGGVGDTTIIAGDLTDSWKWPRELEQWTLLMQNAREQIQKSDRLIQLAGDPQQLTQQLIESVPALMAPIDNALGLQTRLDALKFSRELYSLGSVAVQTYDDTKKVEPNYRAFGETVKRDPKRYARFVFQEGMNARYKQAVDNAETVEKAEMSVQKKALQDLAKAHTATEIAVLNAVITASKERLDLAHEKAGQAKAELDALRGQLLVEDARKDEADREWAQAVIVRMREKALAAYKAQFPTAETDGGN
jgi:hypothetical protein